VIQTRTIEPPDQNFVYASWLNNFKESPFAKRITHAVYFENQKRVIEKILERPGSSVIIACDIEDPWSIFGYLVYERTDDAPVIHYAFVKAIFQKMGIMNTMLKAARVDLGSAVFTHWTSVSGDFLKKHPGLTYDPYRA
jgi:hypothetical protein